MSKIDSMKTMKKTNSGLKKTERVIAQFGAAQLIKNEDGRYELRGGTREDKMNAIEWISLFMHEATPEIK